VHSALAFFNSGVRNIPAVPRAGACVNRLIHGKPTLQNLEVSMRGMGHADPMETAPVTHQEGNEGKKNGVKRGNRGFYGGKLLKRKGEMVAAGEKNVALPGPGQACSRSRERRGL